MTTDNFGGRLHTDPQDFLRARLMRCCLLILRKCYGIEKEIDFPLLRVITDPDTGLDRYFKIKPDFRFVDVHTSRTAQAAYGSRTSNDHGALSPSPR